MGIFWSVAAALFGAAAGSAYGVYLGRVVADRRPWVFWTAAIGAFVLGVGIAAAGGVAGSRPAAFLGFAFAASAATVLKWVSGKVPAVRGAGGAS